MDTLFLMIGIVGFIIFFFFAYNFYLEDEKRPAKVSLISAFVVLAFFIFFYFVNFDIKLYIEILILFLLLIFSIYILYPTKDSISQPEILEKERYDERDVMFSRAELIKGTKRFEEYYQRRKEKLELDNKFRKKPGLLSPKATEYHKFMFPVADANFMIVNRFVPELNDDNLPSVRQNVDAEELSLFIKKWVKQIGAVSVGITYLRDYHLYSVKGRGEDYGKPIVQNHKYAIAFTVEMSKEMLDRAPGGEAIMESSQQYLRSAAMAAQISRFIRNLGYSAKPHFDGNYQVIVGLVARDAGLGDFGRMGLLMTPELGARVRIAVVTTDIPLIPDIYKPVKGMFDFCVICKKCADNCPSKAISFDEPDKENNFVRWTINHEACFTYWTITGTDCGKCIKVCPYSHPNNFMHNIIRYGIKNSYNFGKFALFMDDVFYGRKPKRKTSIFEKSV